MSKKQEINSILKNIEINTNEQNLQNIENDKYTENIQKVTLNTSKTLSNQDLFTTFEILEKNYEIAHEILSERTSKHSEISKNVKRQLKYIGFVYYIWNPENLNIKVIPLMFAYPILDIVNLKEFYYLQRPSLFIEGKPIWVIIRGIPVSVELSIKEVSMKNNQYISLDNMIRKIELKGYTPAEIRAKLESMFATYLFGKPHWQLKDYLMFILILIICGLIEYLILSGIFLGV